VEVVLVELLTVVISDRGEHITNFHLMNGLTKLLVKSLPVITCTN
jgi:hypothetical protein